MSMTGSRHIQGNEMSNTPEAYRAAYALIDQFGRNASSVAASRAAECERNACKESAQMWFAIQKIVESVERQAARSQSRRSNHVAA